MTREDIKKQYRAVMLKWHPDKHHNAGEEAVARAVKMSQEINQAYEWFKERYNIV